MANYVLLERITVGLAGASSVTFNNIPQTGYTDLKLVVSAKGTDSAARGMLIAFNGSSSTFSGKYLIGDGSSPSSGSLAQYVGSIFGTGGTANTFNNTEIYIPNYLGSQQKSFSVDNVAENNGSTGYANIIAGLWATTSAISSINLSIQVGSFIQYSTFSLYALAAVGTTPTKAPKAIGGDIIQTDGTYWYHAFLSSGSFTPQTALSCDVLVVAGGGGSGFNVSGGGGAGGLLVSSSQSLTANSAQTVTIGAGGSNGGTQGANGGNSVFGSLTAVGGGGSGGGTVSAGLSGGSGGGAGGYQAAGSFSGGSATSGQGNAGGSSQGNTTPPYGNYSGGGGGGAGSAGANAASPTSTGGAGGSGASTVSWSGGTLQTALSTLGLGQNVSGTYYIAGGGGAGSGAGPGAGGNGGGGAAGNSGTGTAGTPNTGGGAGGSGGSNSTGTNGGSGLVIVRYAY